MQPNERRNSVLGALLVLVVRGVLLWLVVPIAVCAWPIVLLIRRGSGVTIGQYLGWIDLNLVACLQRAASPLLVRNPLPWTPATEMAGITHRLRAIDPV